MTKTQLIYRCFALGIIITGISSISMNLQYWTGMPVANTTFWWILHLLVLLIGLLCVTNIVPKEQARLMQVVLWYLLWNIFSFFRGCLIAETYWDWKGLVGNSMALMIPFLAYGATDTKLLKRVLRTYLIYGLPLFFLFAGFISNDSYGFYLVPVSFMALFLPVLPRYGKIVILFFILIVVVSDLGARSNVIKFIVPILFSALYYFRAILTKKILLIGRSILFIIPVLLFSLALMGNFNIFHLNKYIKGSYSAVSMDVYGNKKEEYLLADTRTFLYKEVLYTARVYNSWWIGRSPARGNISRWFGSEDLNYRGERLGNEVAILNIFTWTGIAGVILYGLAFFKAATLAITKSNNYFCKIIGLFISFHWAYSWVENINYFTLTTVFLWITIGLCFSKQFRRMNDSEFIDWIRDIFRSKYRIVW